MWSVAGGDRVTADATMQKEVQNIYPHLYQLVRIYTKRINYVQRLFCLLGATVIVLMSLFCLPSIFLGTHKRLWLTCVGCILSDPSLTRKCIYLCAVWAIKCNWLPMFPVFVRCESPTKYCRAPPPVSLNAEATLTISIFKATQQAKLPLIRVVSTSEGTEVSFKGKSQVLITCRGIYTL